MTIHRALAGLAAVLGASAPLVDIGARTSASTLAQEIEAEADHIDALELAELLIKADGSVVLLDLRTPKEFREFHIPTAELTTVGALATMNLPREKTTVVYSEGGGHAAQAWVLLRMRGYRNVLFLREGIYEWVSRIDQPRLAMDATEKERIEYARASKLSRFFGGTPQADVPRAEVPSGYWTTTNNNAPAPGAGPQQKVRRRGC